MFIGQVDDSFILTIIDRYGVAIGMLILFVIATVYILRRLLNDKNGILAKYIESTIAQQKHLADTIRLQAETDKQISDLLGRSEEHLEAIRETVDRVETNQHDPHSVFASVTLGRCFRHGLDVVERISEKLDIIDQCKPALDLMRRELDTHNAIVETDKS